ncbi:DUF2269 family protein [Paenibacillus thalictri]|uniref:DUF2269 family protein n=1 Tax=Paenibacillus thalictri TaxID=2527873 RepID=A0A4Q9DTJ0_9BACL|nr:DUF2269 family protein [Paenibacillus thalictri]TBL80253.1 DUF2269 family protein [Paenibacillus thalictri]
MYVTLVYLHIVSTVVAIGPFFLLIPLLGKIRKAADAELQVHLDSFRFAVQLSKHSGHVLIATGLLLMWLGSWPWTTSWILATWIVLATSLYFFARAFSPTIRKLRSSELAVTDREPLVRKLARSLYLYLLLLFLMMWFMVAKPAFG